MEELLSIHRCDFAAKKQFLPQNRKNNSFPTASFRQCYVPLLRYIFPQIPAEKTITNQSKIKGFFSPLFQLDGFSNFLYPENPYLSASYYDFFWRRERDSNPRSRFWRDTRFPIVPLRPSRASLRDPCLRQDTFSQLAFSL